MSTHLVTGSPPAGQHRRFWGSYSLGACIVSLAVLGASPAAALRIVDTAIDGTDAWREGRSRCESEEDIVVSARITEAASEALSVQHVLVAEPRCPQDGVGGEALDEPSRHVPIDGEVTLRTTVSRDALLGAGACGEDPEVGRRFEGVLCVQVRDDVDGELIAVSAVRVAFDTAVPLPPVLAEVRGDDDTLSVTIEPDPTEEQVLRVEHRRCVLEPAAANDPAATANQESACGARGNFLVKEGPAPAVAVDGLPSNSTWEVQLRVVDDFGNMSTPTEAMVVQLRDAMGVVDLLEPTGSASCASATSAPAWAVAALFVAVWLPRCRRRFRARGAGRLQVLLTAVAVVTATSTPAWSAPSSRVDGRWTGSLSVGLHHPDIDAASRFPVWACVFGDASLVPVRGDVDVHLWDGFGSLQLSVGVEGTQARGFAQPASSSSVGLCGRPSKVAVQLAMLGGRAGITWRLDQLLDEFGVPIVPYARVGGAALGYLFTKGTIIERRNPRTGLDGSGVRLGVEAAGGLMFALDALDLASAKAARSSSGLVHSFLFIETAAQEFGLSGLPLDLTPVDRTFHTGLPLSFRVGLAVEIR
jgi:hypothetical protein